MLLVAVLSHSSRIPGLTMSSDLCLELLVMFSQCQHDFPSGSEISKFQN